MLRRLLPVFFLGYLAIPASLPAQENEHPLVTMGLIHEVKLSQTIDDVTVTLDWVYADTLGFVLQTTLAGLPPEVKENIHSAVTLDARLRDTLGNEFSIRGSQVMTTTGQEPLTSIFTYYGQAVRQVDGTAELRIDDDYFNNQYETLPEALDLQFEISLVDISALHGSPPAGIEVDVPTPDPAFAPVGPFVFDFTVPLRTAVTLEPGQTVEAENLAMTLETLKVAPINAEARLCIELPDMEDWQPQVSITVNGEAGVHIGGGITDMAQFQNEERRCFDLRFYTFHEGEVETVTVSLDAIEKSMREGLDEWNRIQEVLAEQGIEMIVNAEDHGVSVDLPDLPDGMTYQDAIDRAREELGDRIAGPWVFEVAVP